MDEWFEAVIDWFVSLFDFLTDEETIEQVQEAAEYFAAFTNLVRTWTGTP